MHPRDRGPVPRKAPVKDCPRLRVELIRIGILEGAPARRPSPSLGTPGEHGRWAWTPGTR